MTTEETHDETIVIGDDAPDVRLEMLDGRTQTLDAFRQGRPLVLFFYPKDDTPGCTTEALAFTEHRAAFDAVGVALLGVSKDGVDRHRKFIAKHGLTVDLASDGGEVCEAFGVWRERSMYGRTSMGIERSTFLIDGDGRIAQVWRKVKVKGHVESVLEAAVATTGTRSG